MYLEVGGRNVVKEECTSGLSRVGNDLLLNQDIHTWIFTISHCTILYFLDV